MRVSHFILGIAIGMDHKYNCEHCTYSTDRLDAYKRHLNKKRPCATKPLAIVDDVDSSDPVSNALQCPHCDRLFSTKYYAQKHIDEKKCQKMPALQCPICLTMFNSAMEKYKHKHSGTCTLPADAIESSHVFGDSGPDVSEPDDSEPDDSVPGDSVPDDSVPEDSVPDASVPEYSVPEDSVPEDSVPDDSVPEDSVPDDSVPDDSVPDDSVPVFDESVFAICKTVNADHMYKTSSHVSSVERRVVPPPTAGVYLAICLNPDMMRFEFQDEIPIDKDVVGYGFSTCNMCVRVDKQDYETGDYRFVDCVETVHAAKLEKALKEYVKYARLKTIKGTYTDPGGKKHTKTEFFLADSNEYIALFSYLKSYAEKLDITSKEESIRQHEIIMAEHKTNQLKETTRQRELELEIIKHKLKLNNQCASA